MSSAQVSDIFDWEEAKSLGTTFVEIQEIVYNLFKDWR